MIGDDEYVEIRKKDFEFLAQHCCNCPCLRTADRRIANNIEHSTRPAKRRQPQDSEKPKRRKYALPLPGQWQKDQHEIVRDKEYYERVISSFTRADAVKTEDTYSTRLATNPPLVEIGIDLAILTTKAFRNQKTQTAFANFQCLILLSYCLYLEKKGFSFDDIDIILRTFIDYAQDKRIRLLSQASAVNATIVEIARLDGWDIFRATEYFFIYHLKLTSLRDIQNAELRELLQSLSDNHYDFSDCLKPIYTLPGLIKQLLNRSGNGTIDTAEEIGALLGYDCGTIPSSTEDIHKVYAATRNPTTTFDVICLDSQVVPPSDMTATSKQDAIQNRNDHGVEPITDSIYLYLLFCCLGGSIPDVMLLRIGSAQVRWNDEGELVYLTASDARLDQRLLGILSADYGTHGIIPSLCKVVGASQVWIYAGPSPSGQHIMSGEWFRVCIEALEWICFVFPRVESEEPCYAYVGRLLLPYLFRVLEQLKQVQLPRATKHDVAEVLLTASAFADYRDDVSPLIATYLDDESSFYLRAGLALQESISRRLRGEYRQSEHAIHKFCCPCELPSDDCLPRFFRTHSKGMKGRDRALCGLLHRSHLENLVQNEQYVLATTQIADWDHAPELASRMDRTTVPSRTLTSCKIYRSQGNFQDVRRSLELCLNSLHPHEALYPRILCQLLDVYSDLGLPALSSQSLATAPLEPRSRAKKRVLVTEVDIHIQNQDYSRAMGIIGKLHRAFEKQTLNVSDELLHVRMLIAEARISHIRDEFRQASEKWRTVLDHVQKYESFRGEGFTYAAVYLSLSLAYLELDEVTEAASCFGHGRRILKEKKLDYWIPTLPTWLRFVAAKMQRKSGWNSSECLAS